MSGHAAAALTATSRRLLDTSPRRQSPRGRSTALPGPDTQQIIHPETPAHSPQLKLARRAAQRLAPRHGQMRWL